MFKLGQRANCFSKFGKELGQLESGELQEPSCRWYQLYHQGTVYYLVFFHIKKALYNELSLYVYDSKC